MYLIEIKSGEVKIRKYVLNSKELDLLMQENPQYEYIKILEEVSDKMDKPKTRRRKKW